MKLSYTSEIPQKETLFKLFESTGWNNEYKLSADDFYLAVQNSWYLVSVYNAEKIVGFGRIISDGVLHSLIVDLIVLSDFQEKGIGKNILTRLVEKAKSKGIKDIQLFCAKGKKEFYLKAGFKERAADAPGMEYKI